MYYCKNESDYKKATLDLFVNIANRIGIDEALHLAQIALCQYAIEASTDSEEDQIDGCVNCDIDECLLYKNVNSKDICKNIFIIGIEDVIFPCVAFQDEKHIMVAHPIEMAKCNTKYGIGNWE